MASGSGRVELCCSVNLEVELLVGKVIGLWYYPVKSMQGVELRVATLSSTHPDVDRVLSRALGRHVSLITEAPPKPTREADRTLLDDAPGQEMIRREDLVLQPHRGPSSTTHRCIF